MNSIVMPASLCAHSAKNGIRMPSAADGGEKQQHADAGGARRLREGDDAGGENFENSLHVETPNARIGPGAGCAGR